MADISRCTPDDFSLQIFERIAYAGSIDFSRKCLNDSSLENFSKGLLDFFERQPETELKSLTLSSNLFTEVGLGHLADVLEQLPSVMESLERLNISMNQNITTLMPLAGAGVFESLVEMEVNGCSLSGNDAVPPELCANLPKLEFFELNLNNKDSTIRLTPEALQSLPPGCFMTLAESKVTIELPEPVTLPTAQREEFGARSAKFVRGFKKSRTVAEIMKFAGVQPAGSGSMTKPARKRTNAAARCGACASTSPRFACAGCHQQVYCGESCQKEDWSKHQAVCGSNSDWITTQGEEIANEDKILLNLIFNGERSYWSYVFGQYVDDSIFEPIFAFFGEPSIVRRFDFEELRHHYGQNATLTSVTQQIWDNEFQPPDFELDPQELGSGTYGTVYRARDDDTDELYAVKIFKNLDNPDIEEIVLSEASLMQFVNPIHPLTKERGNDHVIAFFGFWNDVQGGPILISELVDGLDFETYFIKEGFEERTDRWFILDNAIPGLFDGLAYLHSKGIAHRDIKPDNIMLELPSGRPVLIDLGLSCAFGTEEEIAQRLLEKWSCDTGGRGDPETTYRNFELGGALVYTSPEMALVYYNNLTSENKVFAEIEAQQRNDLWAMGLTVLDCVLAVHGTLSYVQFGIQVGSTEETLRSVALIDKQKRRSRTVGLTRIRELIVQYMKYEEEKQIAVFPDSLFQKIRVIEDMFLNYYYWTAARMLEYF